MRIGMWSAAALLLAGCGGGGGADPQGDQVIRLDGAGPLPDGSPPTFSDKVEVKDGRGLYTVNRGGRIVAMPFDLPLDRVDPDRFQTALPLGETDDGVIVVMSEYASRPRKAAPTCEDGTETFVRVFSLPLQREIEAIPVGSCLDGIAKPAREPTWIAPNQFRIETTPPRTYAVTGNDGVDRVEGK